jgi:serine/threonine protein kinase
MMAKGNTRDADRTPRFLPGEQFGTDPSYDIVNADGRRLVPIKELGAGMAGLVYRAKFKNLDRAIKIFSPSRSPSDAFQLQLPVLEEDFNREISLLSQVTHTNIAKIVDYGQAPVGGIAHSYYVMEFIEGEPLGKWAPSASGREFVAVIGQLLEALVYLHRLGYYHLDIKEENVFVQRATPRRRRGVSSQEGLWEQAPHAVLLDVGGAKPVPAYAEGDQRLTVFYSTPKAVRDRLETRVGHPVPRSLLKTEGADLDLYAVGAMLQRLLGQPGVEDALREFLKDSGFRALRWLIDRLVEDTSDHQYESAEQLRGDWDRLYPEYVWPMGLQDLSDSAEASIQLATGQLRVSPPLLDVVNHPTFRRLKRLRQLEFVNELYPDSEHTRYTHSLETFRLARLFLLQLLRHAEFRMLATPDHVEATLLVALLHDIGHYPLLHAFEDFTEEALGPRYTAMPAVSRPLSDEALFGPLVAQVATDPYADAVKGYLVSRFADR